MHDSFRNGTFALGLVAAVILAALFTAVWQSSAIYHHRSAQAEYKAQGYASDRDAEIEDICGRMALGNAIECIREKIQATQESQRAQDDLKAQQEMADWAFWMIVASVAAVVVTATGVVYVAATLGQTRKGVQAAVDVVDVTREMNQRQMRAYVGIVKGEASLDKTTGKLHYRVTIENTGQTPAHNLAIVVMHSYVGNRAKRKARFSHELYSGSRGTIFPKIPAHITRSVDFPPEFDVIQKCLDGEGEFFVHGYMRYCDVFGRLRRTIFNSRINIKNLIAGEDKVFDIAPRGNRSN